MRPVLAVMAYSFIAIALYLIATRFIPAAVDTFVYMDKLATEKYAKQEKYKGDAAKRCATWCLPNAWTYNLHTGCTCRSK